jgi:hypothetical protein
LGAIRLPKAPGGYPGDGGGTTALRRWPNCGSNGAAVSWQQRKPKRLPGLVDVGPRCVAAKINKQTERGLKLGVAVAQRSHCFFEEIRDIRRGRDKYVSVFNGIIPAWGDSDAGKPADANKGRPASLAGMSFNR